MSLIREYELISNEIEGEIITFSVRKNRFSTFCTFNELQGIVGNNGGKRLSKSESCYVPAKELLGRNIEQKKLVKKLTPSKSKITD